MKRQEERHHAAIKEFPRFAERRVGFIAGAEWADANPDGKMLLHVLNKSAEQAKKQMIDRACEWWEDELSYPSMTPEEIKWYKNKINKFRTAMKGE